MLLSLINRFHAPAGQPAAVTDHDVRRLVDGGLGPVYWALLQQQQIHCSETAAQHLQSSDLTARVISSKTRDGIRQICRILQREGIRAVLLKGADVAHRFYPKPHWRVLGDVDLLVSPERTQEAVDLLKSHGFINPTTDPDSRWDRHHHAVPLHHPGLKIWVELHRKLITRQSPFHDEPSLDNQSVFAQTEASLLGGETAWFMSPDLCYLHTAAHWYFDLIDRWGARGLQRQVVDGYFMRRAGVSVPRGISPELTRAEAVLVAAAAPADCVSPSMPRPMQHRMQALGALNAPTRNLLREVGGEVFLHYLRGEGSRYWLSLTLGAVRSLGRAMAATVRPRQRPDL